MKLLILIITIIICGCTPKYNVIQSNEAGKSVRLSRDVSVYISLPENNTSNGYLYVGSGREVAAEIEFLFSKYLRNVLIGKSVESCQQGLTSAKNNGYNYHICPQLLRWEDYATEWSGIPDIIKLKVSITSTKSDEIIDTFLAEGKGKVWTWGGDHPLDIVKEPMTQWINSLF